MLSRGVAYQAGHNLSSDASQPDETLITACLGGEEKAWESLIAKYNRLIYSIPFRHGLSENEAADIFQTVCLRLLENLQGLRDSTKLTSWLITTTSRECWNVTRKRAKFSQKTDGEEKREREEADLSPLPEEMALWLEEQQAVREAYKVLPERCQRLLWYLFYDRSELSYSEIGKRLGVPDGSVGPLRARCLEKLRTLLEDADSIR